MLENLKRPYSTEFSLDKTEDFIFFTDKIIDFLFPKDKNIRIYIAGVKKTLTPAFKLSKNLVNKPFYTGAARNIGSYFWCIDIESKILTPGFYDLVIEAEQGNGNISVGYCSFGYDIENQVRKPCRPDDFSDFWKESLKKLDGIDLDVVCSEKRIYHKEQIDDYNQSEAALPDNYDPEGCLYDTVESYEVAFNSAGGIRIHGWLAKPCIPEGEDQNLPAILVLPGAGYAGRPRPLEHARHGYIALDIQVHGQGLEEKEHEPTQVSITYADPAYGMKHYYNDIYLHCVQAVNYLCSRSDVDQSRIVCTGGSQGGRLSLTTAALDKRISAVVAGIVHYADVPYTKWAQEVNRSGGDGLDVSADQFMDKAVSYYDVLSFAPDINCPTLLIGGSIDKISPPGGIAALYQYIKTDVKKLKYMASMSHDWCYQYDIEAWKWLKAVLHKI